MVAFNPTAFLIFKLDTLIFAPFSDAMLCLIVMLLTDFFFHFGNNLQQHLCSFCSRRTGKTASFDLKRRDNYKTAASTMRNTTIYSIKFRTTFFIYLSLSSTQSALSLKESLKLSTQKSYCIVTGIYAPFYFLFYST